jgi:serine/threonine protein kinase
MSEEHEKQEELVEEIVGNYRMEVLYYLTQKTIGQGTYGKVRLGINQISGDKVILV